MANREERDDRTQSDDRPAVQRRDFAGTSFAADQQEQTAERNRVVREGGRGLDEAGEPADDADDV